jgi:hypothetical protein
MRNLEIVKTVNGVHIMRAPGTQRFYEIYFCDGISVNFTTIKKATWFIECGLYECQMKKLGLI